MNIISIEFTNCVIGLAFALQLMRLWLCPICHMHKPPKDSHIGKLLKVVD